MRPLQSVAPSIFASVIALGCAGSIAGSDPAGTGDEPAPTPEGTSGATPSAPGAPGVAGPAGLLPLRRLTRDEYSYTLEDLLGDTTRPGRNLPDEQAGSHGFITPSAISALEFRRLMEAAEDVASRAVEDLPRLLPCDPAKTGEDRCATQFIESFGRRAWRRKLAPADVTSVQALYTQARKEWGYDFKGAIRFVVQGLLQAGGFIYRWELGPSAAPTREGPMIKLNSDEVASRLSYLLWSSLPDEALFRAADAGQLATPAAIEAQARRMLGDPKARRSLASFHVQWLGLGRFDSLQKDTKAYPDFTPALRKAMEDEIGLLVAHHFQSGDGKLDALLTSPVGFVNSLLGALYGVQSGGAALERKDLDPSQRAGILTTAAFLAKHGNTYESHPTERGKIVYEQLLCGQLAPPPPDVPQLKPPATGVSTRERYSQHATDAVCATCHRMFDPLGFAFETYDGIGKHRTMDAGKPVDATGTVLFPSGGTKPFKNGVELAKILAGSEDVRRCVLTQWARFALGRREGADDQAAIEGVAAAFGKSDYDLRELLVAFVKSRAFLYRRPAPGEVL